MKRGRERRLMRELDSDSSELVDTFAYCVD
jgi:hypothetical protein